jgi:hypothetical protein
MKVTFNRAKAHSLMSKVFYSVMIAMAIVSFVSCDKEEDGEYFLYTACQITGYVLDDATGQPINGAFIKISGNYSNGSVNTNSNGNYAITINGLELSHIDKASAQAGNSYYGEDYLRFECSANGYTTQTRGTLHVKATETYAENFRLKKK